MTKIKVNLAWSGGKDAAYALKLLLEDSRYQVVGLHTVFDSTLKRVGLHGIHESLIEQQAEQIGLPLQKLYLEASNEHSQYEKLMRNFMSSLKSEGINQLAYGDIFLEDLKKYREKMLVDAGMKAVFPLWGKNTDLLAHEIISCGIQTTICAADSDLIDKKWVGKRLDKHFLDALNDSVDPCGENGEFHTFVSDAPYFKSEIPIQIKDVLAKDYQYKIMNEDNKLVEMKKTFWFADIQH